MTALSVLATQYTVTVYPDRSSPYAARYSLIVQRRHTGLWSVEHLGHHLTADETWSPLDRPEDWREQRKAIRAAVWAVSAVTSNGRTAAECAAWERQQRAVAR